MSALRSLSENLIPLAAEVARRSEGRSLGDLDWQKVGESGAAGGSAGAATGTPWGAGAGAAVGAGVEIVRQTGIASGVDDPAAGRSGAYLVEHPEARGGLSLAEAWRMTFRELGARAWVDDILQAAGSGYQVLTPNGQPYDTPGAFFTVPPAGWGRGPYELWALPGWLGTGRPLLAEWRQANLSRAPAWYGAGSGASSAAGESDYLGPVLGSGGVGGASAPVGRPRFSPTVGAARSINVPSQSGSTSSAWLWVLLLGGGAGVLYLGTRKSTRKGRR